HVHSSLKRSRIVQDWNRLWRDGVRDLVLERCCALHHVRVRLPPWQPMGASSYTQLCVRLHIHSPHPLVEAVPLGILTHCFLGDHHLFASSVSRQMSSMAGYALHKQLFASSLCARVLSGASPHPSLTATLWLRSRWMRETLRRASGQGRARHSAAWTGAT